MADSNALYASLLAADEASDAAALAAVAWQMYGELATTAADLGALRARFRVYAAAPNEGHRCWPRQDNGRLPAAGLTARLLTAGLGPGLPCTDDPELFFAESPVEVERAKGLCRECPAWAACPARALQRREVWGVWGGELFLCGAIVRGKRPRGRPRKTDVAA